jgi:hypothetical protein
MENNMSTNILIGSHREPLPGARAVGKSNPAERLEVTVLVRRQNADAFKAKVAGLAAGERSAGHMKHADLAKEFGAAPADMAAVTTFAKRHDLAVVQEDASRRAVVLSGTVAQFNQAFGVDLQQFEFDGGSYRGRTGPIALPNALKGSSMRFSVSTTGPRRGRISARTGAEMRHPRERSRRRRSRRCTTSPAAPARASASPSSSWAGAIAPPT